MASKKKPIFERNVPSKIFKPKFRTSNPANAYLRKPDNVDYRSDVLSDTNIESSSSAVTCAPVP